MQCVGSSGGRESCHNSRSIPPNRRSYTQRVPQDDSPLSDCEDPFHANRGMYGPVITYDMVITPLFIIGMNVVSIVFLWVMPMVIHIGSWIQRKKERRPPPSMGPPTFRSGRHVWNDIFRAYELAVMAVVVMGIVVWLPGSSGEYSGVSIHIFHFLRQGLGTYKNSGDGGVLHLQDGSTWTFRVSMDGGYYQHIMIMVALLPFTIFANVHSAYMDDVSAAGPQKSFRACGLFMAAIIFCIADCVILLTVLTVFTLFTGVSVLASPSILAATFGIIACHIIKAIAAIRMELKRRSDRKTAMVTTPKKKVTTVLHSIVIQNEDESPVAVSPESNLQSSITVDSNTPWQLLDTKTADSEMYVTPHSPPRP